MRSTRPVCPPPKAPWCSRTRPDQRRLRRRAAAQGGRDHPRQDHAE
jgi:hypothetical protein